VFDIEHLEVVVEIVHHHLLFDVDDNHFVDVNDIPSFELPRNVLYY
jgi:hypothetical protein